MAGADYFTMKPKTTKPTTPHGKLINRVCEVWLAHSGCLLAVGDIEPCTEVVHGGKVMVMVAMGPLMITRYVNKADTQWLFDCYAN